MKKVLALVLAVMMLATVAMADGIDSYAKKRHIANLTPGDTITIDKNGIKDTGVDLNDPNSTVDTTNGSTWKAMSIVVNDENGNEIGGQNDTRDVSGAIFRSITNTNYTINRVRIEKGSKNLVKGVSINDKDETVEVDFIDDLDNQTSKTFEVAFTLKGKAKFTLRDVQEVYDFNEYCSSSKVVKVAIPNNPSDPKSKTTSYDVTPAGVTKSGLTQAKFDEYVNDQAVGKRVTLPDVDFKFIGTVGYGRVEVSLGDDNDEEIEDLGSMGINKSKDVVKFKNGGVVGTSHRVAGAFVADAILTEDYGDSMTLVGRVYHNDEIFFKCSNTPNKDIVGRLADSDADMDFYLFNTNTKYTTFNSNVNLYFNDAEEDDFIYQIKDGKLVKTGTWSDDEDCWVVKTRVLGQYVVSDVELTEFEAAPGEANPNPDTGANDVVGIATALAAVALVSAAAVSLKK